uniref:PNPLA domain-containing protein n=1 Tax=Gouania willdenowi TaxID=441366 RepID=A0A8C5GQS2_GOUWI
LLCFWLHFENNFSTLFCRKLRMSRLRTTLDSVTRAVGSTDLISKFSRLKPGGYTADGTNAEKTLLNAANKLTSSNTTAVSSPDTKMKAGEENATEEKSDKQCRDGTEKTFVIPMKPTPTLASAANQSAASSSPNVAKQTMQLFQPVNLSTSMDETYKTLAHHINTYFVESSVSSSSVEEPSAAIDEKSSLPSAAPPIPVPTTHSKKGFTHYLSYPRPSVQAFVGSYIAPLVPKFRGEKEKSAAVAVSESIVEKEKAVEKTDNEEKEAENVRKLQMQREKIIARVSVDNRTRALVKGLQRVTDVKLLTTRVEELSYHFLEFPETRGVAIKEGVLPCLLKLRQARDLPLHASVREAIASVGYTDPVKGRGIRVLAIDGGGTRGLLALQTLHKLEGLTGKRIHELFDYICGVSTGAILAFMLGIFQIPLEECEEMYRKLGTDVFNQNVIVGTVKMGWSHAFYDSEMWENILKERLGDGLMIESARDPNCPKVSAVSTIVNRGLPLKAHVFRNYRLMPGVRSHYLGDCKHKMWQAIRASSAAPGYFQEFALGKDLHQDGGLLINNPTALAIHECKCLWPNTPLQCVLSLGTGRYETTGKNNVAYTSLKTKLTNVISSATDTEEVHTMLDALLPPDTYFRFNPLMSEDVPMNESRREKLNFLISEGERYLELNEVKLKKAASVLGQEKGAIQRLAEWAKLKADMYEGLPFGSKL